MGGMGRLKFSEFFSQNCQFHHRRLESLEHLMCLIYILLSTTVSHFLDLTDAFFTRSPFLFLYTFPFCKYTLHVCYVFNVNLMDSFDDRRSQCRFWSNDRAAPTDTNPKNLELAPPQSVTATRLDQLVYSPNYYIQIFQTQLFACSEDWTLNLLARSYQVQRAYQLRYGSYINESLHHMKQPHPLKTDHLAIVITLDSKKKYKWYYELTKNKLKLPFPVLYVNYHFPWIKIETAWSVIIKNCKYYINMILSNDKLYCMPMIQFMYG